MKRILTQLITVTIVIVILAFGTGCSDKEASVAPQNDASASDTTTESSLSVVMSPAQSDPVATGQTLALSCSSSVEGFEDLSFLWSANCGTLNRRDSSAVEWLAPDTNASAEISVTAYDGHRQLGDTLRLGVQIPPLVAVLSPSQYDFMPTGQTLAITCSSGVANSADLSFFWSANCGTLNRTDSRAVEWLAPDTGASAEIIVTVSDGQRQAGDTLRLGVVVNSTWEKSYNLGGYEDGQDVLCADDGGYVVLVSHGGVRLVKILDDGTLLWDRYYLLYGSFWCRSVTALPDGGYIITGGQRTIVGTDVLFDFFLLKVDAAGNLMWHKTFDDINGCMAYDAVGMPDGGLLVVGSADAVVGDIKGVCLIRTDADGNMLWQKTFVGSRATTVITTSDNQYAITGPVGESCSGTSGVLLLIVDADGNVIRETTVGNSSGGLSFGLVETPGGGFAISGQLYSSTSGGWDGFLLLTDHDGNLMHRTDFGGDGDDLIRDIVNRPQGGFVIAGYTKSFGEGNADMYLTAFDDAGMFEWGKTFGGPDLEEGQGIVCAGDAGFVVVGRTMSFSEDLCDLYVVKTDRYGRVWGQSEN